MRKLRGEPKALSNASIVLKGASVDRVDRESKLRLFTKSL
jgi:hypothetical protein